MRFRAFLMASASLAMILSSASTNGSGAKFRLRQRHASKVATTSNKRCLTEDQLFEGIRKLSGQIEVDQARSTFLAAARRSLDCRRRVIAALMNAMDKPNLDLRFNQADNDLWREGSNLLADLKAVEALDFLVTHLDIDNGEFSRTMSHMPALTALIKMGKSAVPALSEVLLNNPDSTKRQYAVFCLFFIRGRAASAVLRNALHSETDKCVRRFIHESIKGLNKQHSTAEDTEGWFSAFGCTHGPSWRKLSRAALPVR